MPIFFSLPDFRAGVTEMLPAVVSLTPFGLVCGVAAASIGASPLEALGLSAIVFSGAAQILATQLYAAGAPLAVIVLACFVIGLRLVVYSAALAPHFATLPSRWRHLGAFLLTDQSFATGVRRFAGVSDQRGPAAHFVGGGAVCWIGWQIQNAIGYFAGNVIPASWQLDFAVPLCFIALVVPLFRDRTMIVSGVAAAVAVVALSGLPMRLNIVVAGLVGIAVGAAVDSFIAKERT